MPEMLTHPLDSNPPSSPNPNSDFASQIHSPEKSPASTLEIKNPPPEFPIIDPCKNPDQESLSSDQVQQFEEDDCEKEQEHDEQDQQGEDEEGVNMPISPRSQSSGTKVNYSKRSVGRKRKGKRGIGQKYHDIAIQKKMQALSETFKPIPFVPDNILDFSKHEENLKKLGLWDFAHVEFDRDIRDELIKLLIVNYVPKSRNSYVNDVRVKVSRADLARALKLPVKKPAGDLEGECFSAEFLVFVEEFVLNWMLLHESDMWVMPSEVVNWLKLIKEGQPQKLDWAGLIWFMMEKELARGSNLEECWYASHFQLLIKDQKEELFNDTSEVTVEENQEVVEVELEDDEGGDTKILDVEETFVGEVKSEDQSNELRLGQDFVTQVGKDGASGSGGHEGDSELAQKGSETTLKGGDSEMASKDADFEMAQKGDYFEIVLKGVDSEMVLKSDDSVSAQKGGDSSMALKDADSEASQKNGDSEAVQKDGDSEAEPNDVDSEMALKVGDFEMAQKDVDSETAQKDVDSKMAQKDADSKTSQKDVDPATAEKDVDSVTSEKDVDSVTVEKDSDSDMAEKAGDTEMTLMYDDFELAQQDGDFEMVQKDGDFETVQRDGDSEMARKDGDSDIAQKMSQKDGVSERVQGDGDVDMAVKGGDDVKNDDGMVCLDEANEEVCGVHMPDFGAQRQWLGNGSDDVCQPFLKPCSITDDKAFTENAGPHVSGNDVKDEEGEDCGQAQGFKILPRSNLDGMSSVSLMQALETGHLPYTLTAFDGPSSLELMSTRAENDIMLDGSSLFNHTGKRGTDFEHDISHPSLNQNHKRMKMDEHWDQKPPDFSVCMDQLHQWMEKAKVSHETERDEAYRHVNMMERACSQQVDEKVTEIVQLRYKVDELQRSRQAEVSRRDRELHLMNNVIHGYRVALKESQRTFAEYRKRCRVPDEPFYKDAGSGGVVKSIRELEKERLMKEEEERKMRHLLENAFNNFLNNFDSMWQQEVVYSFDVFGDRLEAAAMELNILKAKIVNGYASENVMMSEDIHNGNSEKGDHQNDDEYDQSSDTEFENDNSQINDFQNDGNQIKDVQPQSEDSQRKDVQIDDTQMKDFQNDDSQIEDVENNNAHIKDIQNDYAQIKDVQNDDAQLKDVQNVEAQNADAQNGDTQVDEVHTGDVQIGDTEIHDSQVEVARNN